MYFPAGWLYNYILCFDGYFNYTSPSSSDIFLTIFNPLSSDYFYIQYDYLYLSNAQCFVESKYIFTFVDTNSLATIQLPYKTSDQLNNKITKQCVF